MGKYVYVKWFHNRNAYCIQNGITERWCDPSEFNETVAEAEKELEEHLQE